MIAKIETSTVLGIDAFPVEVEVDASGGLPGFSIVGLPDTACRESQDRVRSAIRNSGYRFPSTKITVNLAPAGLRKEGAAFDLPIALGILAASGQIKNDVMGQYVFVGELALDGKVRSVLGCLSRVAALRGCDKTFVFPHINFDEARIVEGVPLLPVRTLSEAVHGIGESGSLFEEYKAGIKEIAKDRRDFFEVKGQYFARRGIEVAAAGGHNILLMGPPGSGKTMLAKRIPTILTTLTPEESIETTKIHSVCGRLKGPRSLIDRPPFRNPHHTISDAAMVGGGAYPRPGEISLSHHGVLFLDELPEFRRNVLEALRQPLEDGRILVSRAAFSHVFPAQFMLVAAMNPCPCGYFSDTRKTCACSPLQIRNYLGKISGPLLDRIDIHLEVASLKIDDFDTAAKAEDSLAIRRRVEKVRRIQRKRYGQNSKGLNSRLDSQDAEVFCRMTADAQNFMKQSLNELGFSGRAYHKVLKVSRTIADMEESELVSLPHVQEAVQYRSLDRRTWLS